MKRLMLALGITVVLGLGLILGAQGASSLLNGDSHPDFVWEQQGRAPVMNLNQCLQGSTWEVLNKSYSSVYNDKIGYITFSPYESSFTLDEGVFVGLGMVHMDVGSGAEFPIGDNPYEIINNGIIYSPWKAYDKNGNFRRDKKDYALMIVKNKNEIIVVAMGNAGKGLCLMKRVD